MVSSWLIKVVLAIVIIGGGILELGSPFIAKAQLDSQAHDIADEVAFRVTARGSRTKLETVCDEEFAKRSVEKVRCDVEEGKVVVTARKEARSLILKNISATEDWYTQELTVTAELR